MSTLPLGAPPPPAVESVSVLLSRLAELGGVTAPGGQPEDGPAHNGGGEGGGRGGEVSTQGVGTEGKEPGVPDGPLSVPTLTLSVVVLKK